MWEHFDGVECANDSDLLLEEMLLLQMEMCDGWASKTYPLTLTPTKLHITFNVCNFDSTAKSERTEVKQRRKKHTRTRTGFQDALSICRLRKVLPYCHFIRITVFYFFPHSNERRCLSVAEVVIIDRTQNIRQYIYYTYDFGVWERLTLSLFMFLYVHFVRICRIVFTWCEHHIL